MENQQKLNSSKEVIALLAKCFPLCFSMEGEARPLKIGIFQDIVERIQENAFSKTQLRSALRLYTSSWRYLYGIKVGAQRIDLDGKPCGELEQQHIEHARQQLETAKARIQAQRAEKAAKKREKVSASEESIKIRRQRAPVRKKSAEEHKKQHTPITSMTTTAGITRKDHPVLEDPSRVIKKAALRTHTVIPDISDLKIGQEIKVKAGKSAVNATVLEIAKGGVRVQLLSGLAMIVRAEHLQF